MIMFTGQPAELPTSTPQDGSASQQHARQIFATRDEGSGGGGVSGGAIGGVVILLLIVLFVCFRSRRPITAPFLGIAAPTPTTAKVYAPSYPDAHPPVYLPQYTGPQYAYGQHIGSPAMPPVAHLPRNSGYYAPAPQVEPQKGVRFGGVGVARYT